MDLSIVQKVASNSKTFGCESLAWIPGHWVLDQLKMSAPSSVQKNTLDKDESIKSTRNMQEAQPSCDELEGRKCTLTQKGFEYHLPFKKIYEDALTKLRNCVDTVDMLWIDASDIDKLCHLRTELEESREAFEIARSGYAPFYQKKNCSNSVTNLLIF